MAKTEIKMEIVAPKSYIERDGFEVQKFTDRFEVITAPRNTNNLFVKWESSNEDIFVIHPDEGFGYACKPGKVTITANLVSEDGRYDLCTATMLIEISESGYIDSYRIISDYTRVEIGGAIDLKAQMVTDAPGTTTDPGVEWFSKNPDIATVDKVWGRGDGSLVSFLLTFWGRGDGSLVSFLLTFLDFYVIVN